MLPIRTLRVAIADLLAANAATLAPAANANWIFLIMEDFSPNEILTFGDLVTATFTGSDEIEGEVGAQQVGNDPMTDEQIISILAPVGGYRWEVHTNTTNLPQTIYGYALVSQTFNTLLAMHHFDVPITLTQIGDFIDIGTPTIRFVLQPMS